MKKRIFMISLFTAIMLAVPLTVIVKEADAYATIIREQKSLISGLPSDNSITGGIITHRVTVGALSAINGEPVINIQDTSKKIKQSELPCKVGSTISFTLSENRAKHNGYICGFMIRMEVENAPGSLTSSEVGRNLWVFRNMQRKVTGSLSTAGFMLDKNTKPGYYTYTITLEVDAIDGVGGYGQLEKTLSAEMYPLPVQSYQNGRLTKTFTLTVIIE